MNVVLKRVWIRVRCDIVSSDEQRIRGTEDARKVVNGECRGVGCPGCYWRATDYFVFRS